MTEGSTGIRIQHDPDLASMTTPGVSGADMAVAIPIAAATVNDEDPQPCLYLTTLIKLFMWDRSPAQALCSLLATCWFWPSGCEAEGKDLFLGSVLMSLGRFLKDKLACLTQDIAACLSCWRDLKGDKQAVTMGCCARCLWQVLTEVADNMNFHTFRWKHSHNSHNRLCVFGKNISSKSVVFFILLTC